MKYIVEHFTLCDGWINCWSIINEDGTQTPQTFETESAAQAEINDFFADIAEEIERGEREASEGYDRSEYRVRSLK